MLRKILCLAGLLAYAYTSRAHNASVKDLRFPPPGQCFDSAETNIQAIHRVDKQLFQTSRNKNVLLVSPFNGFMKDSEQSFGAHAATKRIALPKDIKNTNWSGITSFDNKLFMLDGKGLNVAVLSLDKLQFVTSRTFAWDMIRPARDANGDAPSFETASLRKKFYTNFHAAPETKFSGLAFDRTNLLGTDAYYFFVGTKIINFPLVTMKCSKEDATSCYIDRACFLEGFKDSGADVSGLAFDPMSRSVIFSHAKHQTLNVFSFKSCFNVTFKKTLTLDSKFKPATALHGDHEGTLWLGTQQYDDYNNASVYAWSDLLR